MTIDRQPTARLQNDKLRAKRRGSEALKVAIELADIEFCKQVIEDGAELSQGFSACHGSMPLLYALRQSPIDGVRLEIAEFLALQGASIEGSTCGLWKTIGYTVFHYAACFGYL